MELNKFIKSFDLQQINLQISDYEVINNAIVIKEIKILDNEMQFVRFADINKVEPYLKFSNVFFSEKNKM